MLSVLLALSPLQLSLLCHPTITFLLVAAAAVQTNKNPEKVFEFPEYDYTETPKNVRNIIIFRSLLNNVPILATIGNSVA